MTSRAVLYCLLTVVAGAAAVLSFAALRDLALLCGFVPQLAWLLPVVVDAGAAAGSLVWLGGRVDALARRFARALALTLLGLSVAANALAHGLDAYRLAPAWWVVVVVSAIAPAVLGAVVHLAVLVGRAPPLGVPSSVAPGVGDRELLDEDGLFRLWETAPPAAEPAWSPPNRGHDDLDVVDEGDHDEDGRVADLIAAGVGRRRLSRELGVTEYEARRLLADARTTTPALIGVPQ